MTAELDKIVSGFRKMPVRSFRNPSELAASITETGRRIIREMMLAMDISEGLLMTPIPVRTFSNARGVASVFGLHKSPKPALAFFAGVEYVHVSKAARLLAKHRARDKRKRFTYHASTRDKKRERREARQHAKECMRNGLVERAAVWRKRARNG